MFTHLKGLIKTLNIFKKLWKHRAPNLWTTGQKLLKCLHQKVSKRTSEACQNRKGPDTHSKLTSARAIYRKIQSKSCGSTYFYILPLLFPVGTVPKWHSKFRSVTIIAAESKNLGLCRALVRICVVYSIFFYDITRDSTNHLIPSDSSKATPFKNSGAWDCGWCQQGLGLSKGQTGSRFFRKKSRNATWTEHLRTLNKQHKAS